MGLPKKSAAMDPLDAITQTLQEALADAMVTSEELNEAGDLEDRLEAAYLVSVARSQLRAHLWRVGSQRPLPHLTSPQIEL